MELELRPFESRFAAIVASWPRDERDLLWLAPRTPPPLTPKKVCRWQRANKRTFLLHVGGELGPCAYGEINLMQDKPKHKWLGHLIVAPTVRRRGIGSRLVALLLGEAFQTHAAHSVSLVVFPENHLAQRCYLREGFVHAGDEFHRFRPGQPEYRMQRMTITRQRWLMRRAMGPLHPSSTQAHGLQPVGSGRPECSPLGSHSV